MGLFGCAGAMFFEISKTCNVPTNISRYSRRIPFRERMPFSTLLNVRERSSWLDVRYMSCGKR